MSKIICQCGYTRIGGQGKGSGWQSVALSGNFTPDLERDYSTLQGQNVSNQSLVDKSGEPINMFEVVGKKEMLFMSRIQYGLSDDVGRRNNLFAHTFVIDGSDDYIYRDPNLFLSIPDTAFIRSLDDRESITKEPARERQYNKQTALDACGMTYDLYRDLIYAVYAALADKRPLYVKLADNPGQIRPCLYLIYMGLNLSARRTFSASTCIANAGNVRSVVFSDPQSPADLYFDLITGDNNVLTQKLQRRYSRYGYVDHTLEMAEDKANEYYTGLEKTAALLGDQSASKPSALRIAHKILITDDYSALDEDGVSERLYEALSSGYQSELMDKYLGRLIKLMNDNRWLLPEGADKMLAHYLDDTSDEKVKNSGRLCIANYIMSLSTADAVEHLKAMNASTFRTYADIMKSESKGLEIINDYMEQAISGSASWQELKDLYISHCRDLGGVDYTGQFADRAYALFADALKQGGDIMTSYDECSAMFAELYRGDRNAPDHTFKLKTLYWDSFSFEGFKASKQDEYAAMYDERLERSVLVRKLFEVFEKELPAGYERFSKAADKLLDQGIKELPYDVRKAIWDEFAGKRKDSSAETIEHPERCELAFTVGFMDTEQKAVALIQLFMLREKKDFREIYLKIVDRLIEKSGSDYCVKLFNGCIWESCREKSAQLDQALDFWLVLSEKIYDNPFEFLDHNEETAEALRKTDNEDILGRNVLLWDEYLSKAEEFGEAGESDYSHMVKKWAALIRKEMKKSEKGGKKGLFGLKKKEDRS